MMKAAAVQMNCKVGDKKANMAKAEQMVLDACDAGATLVVLPELFSTGVYDLKDDSLAEMMYHKTTNFLKDLAAAQKIFLVGSFIEIMGDDKRNTTLLCGPNGVLGVYNKVFLWKGEVGVLKRGNDFDVTPTDIGNIGMLACYDIAYPEAGRSLGKKKVNIIVSGSGFYTPNTWDFATKGRAYENSAYHIAANRVGNETGRAFCGRSRIVDPMGNLMTEKVDGEGIVIAELDVAFARKVRAEVGFFQDG